MASEQIYLTQHRGVSGIGLPGSLRPDRDMRVVLIRVGVDTGCRPIHAHGPLFPDGSFEYVPIPDLSAANECRTYGNTVGRSGRPLVDFFPHRRAAIVDHPMHVDPEFETWTYGSPARIQVRLSTLEEGDLLAFYGGLRPFDRSDDAIPPAALYLFGYFDVLRAVWARDHTRDDLLPMFGANFHVRHPELFEEQHDRLVLVKGKPSSRLLSKALRISGVGQDRRGQPIHVLSDEMQEVFGSFEGVGSIQRCVPRWAAPTLTGGAAAFVRSLP